MAAKLANRFLGLGFALYAAAGIAAMSGMKSSIVILLGAVIFSAFGYYANAKPRLAKSPRKGY